MSQLSHKQIVGLAGVIPADELRLAKAALNPGETIEVESRLLLRAWLKKSADTTVAPTCSLLSKTTLAFILRRSGVTADTTAKVLAELGEIAIKSGGKLSDKLLETDDKLLQAVADVQAGVVAKLPRQPRSGRVTVTGEVTELVDLDTLPARIAAEADATPADLVIDGGTCTIEAAGNGQAGEPGVPRFSMVAYTGGLIELGNWDKPVVVDLAGLNIAAQTRPIRLHHDAGRGVGHTERIAVEGTPPQLVATGLISRNSAAADEVVKSARSGFPWQASIGAQPTRVESVRAGQTVTVNGRPFTGPLYVVRAAVLKEISFVDLGGDDQTSTAITAQANSHPLHESDPTMDFKQWLQANGFDHDQLSDAQRAMLKAQYDATRSASASAEGGNPPVTDSASGASPSDGGNRNQPPVQASQDGTSSIDEVIAEAERENQRQQAITAAAERVLTERPGLAVEVGRLAKSSIEAGSSPQQFELDVLRLGRSAPNGFVRRDHARNGRVVEAALCLAGGLDDIDKQFDQQTLEAADDQYGQGGLGLTEALLIHAQANGYTGHGTSNLRGMLQAAFTPGSPGLQASGGSGFSSISIAGILSNVANKFLRRGFDAVEAEWSKIASVSSVRDFKERVSYSLTGGFEYEQVGPDGELKHATAGEEKYTNQADTYGKLFALTRRDLINDDLGALTQVPRRLGRGAALKLNKVFWGTFLGNSAFFTAARNNLLTGAATAFDIDAITAAETAFLNLTDPDGNPMGTMPAILVVPTALKTPADVAMTSMEVHGSTKKTASANPHRGKFRTVSSVYLSNATLTSNSALAWYLLADPNDVPVIDVAFLNGRRQPTVETADADFNVLGINMRGYHDFGVALQEFRGGVKMLGESA
jgi:hypothetical protein